MDQLSDFADSRLINGCIFCDAMAETRDHVPSKIFLDPPYPDNLPVVGACNKCNQGFSKDEQYLACLIESALAGSTDPEKIRRRSIARAMNRAPALRSRIESAKKYIDGRTVFEIEKDRVKNVMLKLARGHAAFDLSQPCRSEPDYFWFGPLVVLSEEDREAFDAPHIQSILGEIGSRGMQRMYATVVSLQPESGEKIMSPQPINDWVEVQNNHYRYLAIDDLDGIGIRIVIADYLACEIEWKVYA